MVVVIDHGKTHVKPYSIHCADSNCMETPTDWIEIKLLGRGWTLELCHTHYEELMDIEE